MKRSLSVAWAFLVGRLLGILLGALLVLLAWGGYGAWTHRHDHANLHTVVSWVTTVDPQVALLKKQVAQLRQEVDAVKSTLAQAPKPK